MPTDALVHVFDDADLLSRAAADLLEREALAAVDARGRFSLVLSGGSTPRRLFTLLAEDYRSRIPWQDTHVYWSDERFVPPDHPDSNVGSATESLLSHVQIPPAQIHRILTDLASPAAAATAYEALLRRHFPGDAPTFDLVLLGMGPDGHTASLFPGRSLASDHWVEAVTGPEYRPPRERITLSLKAINGARTIAFLVTGKEKHGALRAVIDAPESHPDLPAAHIRPRGRVEWFVDRQAHASV